MLPDEFKYRKHRTPKGFKVKKNQLLDIAVMGVKDPRGPDNNIYVYLDDQGCLRIRVQKTNRCYKFQKVEECDGYIEVIAK